PAQPNCRLRPRPVDGNVCSRGKGVPNASRELLCSPTSFFFLSFRYGLCLYARRIDDSRVQAVDWQDGADGGTERSQYLLADLGTLLHGLGRWLQRLSNCCQSP